MAGEVNVKFNAGFHSWFNCPSFCAFSLWPERSGAHHGAADPSAMIQTQGMPSRAGYVHRPAYQFTVYFEWTHNFRGGLRPTLKHIWFLYRLRQEKNQKGKRGLWSRGLSGLSCPTFLLVFVFCCCCCCCFFCIPCRRSRFSQDLTSGCKPPGYQLWICRCFQPRWL